jgi:hypothetical protein
MNGTWDISQRCENSIMSINGIHPKKETMISTYRVSFHKVSLNKKWLFIKSKKDHAIMEDKESK